MEMRENPGPENKARIEV